MRCQPRGGYCEESSSSGCASDHGCGAAARAVSCFNRRAWNWRRTRRPRARRWWAGDGQASVGLVSDRGDDVRLSPAGFVLRLPQRASGRCRQRSPCRVQSAIGGHLSFRIPNTSTRTVSTRPVQRIVELIYTDCARRSRATALAHQPRVPMVTGPRRGMDSPECASSFSGAVRWGAHKRPCRSNLHQGRGLRTEPYMPPVLLCCHLIAIMRSDRDDGDRQKFVIRPFRR